MVHFWDIQRVQHEGELGRHASFAYDVAFSPSSRMVASAAWDGTVRLWDTRTGRPGAVLAHPHDVVTFVAFHPDGRRLASVSRGNRVHVWDLTTGQISAHLELTGGPFAEHRVAFSARGDLVASTGGRDGGIRLFTLSPELPYIVRVLLTTPLAHSGGHPSFCGCLRTVATALRVNQGTVRGRY